jgi:hypothetical protein
MAQFSRFHVLCSSEPGPGRKYRQIVASASEDGTFYEVRIFEGSSVKMDPDFKTEGINAEYYTHPTREAADKDADEERDRGLAKGWVLQDPVGN